MQSASAQFDATQKLGWKTTAPEVGTLSVDKVLCLYVYTLYFMYKVTAF